MAYEISSLYRLLDRLDGKEFIEKYISYNTALISAAVKPSVTLTIKKTLNNKIYKLWETYGQQCLEELELSTVILRESDDYVILLIYNNEILENFLNKEDNREFLEALGYDLSTELSFTLSKLVERYNIYKCPHELGVFLGYPIDDVKGFMSCTREKCIFCGYWKVYKDVEKAKEIFALFDSIKDITIKELISGKRAKDLSLYLRNEFSNIVTM